MERSLILTSTNNSGKKLQKTFTGINPQASAEALKTSMQKLNALTTNTYVQTDCIDKFNVDTEIPPIDTRQEPTLEVPATNWLSIKASVQLAEITTDSDGELSVEVFGTHGAAFGIADLQGRPHVYSCKANVTVTPGQVTLRVAGTETFKPYEKTFDFTAE